jgi:hypothetical protein
MNQWQRIAIAAIAAVIMVSLWLGRYDLEQAGTGPGVFRLDRWTGTVWLFAASGARKIQPEP